MKLNDQDRCWYLAQVKPNCAKIADINLKRQGFKTFMPTEQVTRQRNGKFVHTVQPLFPGYIFVAFDVKRGLWRAVNSTYGVARLVAFNNKPSSVPLELILQLVQRCDADVKSLQSKLLKPGNLVTLTKGPFVNFVVEIEKIAPDQRVWLLIDIMGCKTRLAVTADQL